MRSTEVSSLLFFFVGIVSIADFLAWIVYFSAPHRKKKKTLHACDKLQTFSLIPFFFSLLFLLYFLLFFCRCVLPYHCTSFFFF